MILPKHQASTGYQPHPTNGHAFDDSAVLALKRPTEPTMEQPTGYSAPASELDATPLYSSGSSSATAKAAPCKKLHATPAAPALVVTFASLDLHNASQTVVSSGSEVHSVTSSTERLRRAQLAKAKRELAEARIEEAQTQLDLVAGSQTGSVGRLADVTSEWGRLGQGTT